MDEFKINDSRNYKDFKIFTFSNYLRSKVKSELIKSLHESILEPSCYWSIELLCSGHFYDIWHILLLYMAKYIHISNPKLPIYLNNRLEVFKNIIKSTNYDEIHLRNNNHLRCLFAEIITIVCTSKKNNVMENYSLKTNEDFDINNLQFKLQAPNINYGKLIFKEDDPREIFIAINEFMYHISEDSKDRYYACYWLEWIIKYDINSRNLKRNCECERRSFVPVEDKFQKNIIWLIFDGLFYTNKDKLVKEILNSLLNLFCLRYNFSSNKTKKYLIYFGISLLTDIVDFSLPIIKDKKILKNIINNINIIYKQVKKSEKGDDMDYLYKNINEEKTNKKIDIMNSILNA